MNMWLDSFSRLLFAALACGSAVIGHAAVAHAEPNDSGLSPQEQQYVEALKNDGVQSSHGDRGLANLGRDICVDLARGYSRDDEREAVYEAHRQTISKHQADDIVNFAVRLLCSGQ